jgi:hypothetical protein
MATAWTIANAHTGAPLWALASVNKQPIVGNMGAAGSGKLFQNATADNLIAGITRGLFNYGPNSTALVNMPKGAHQGWVLKTTGSGVRVGRVTGETLVCLSSN